MKNLILCFLLLPMLPAMSQKSSIPDSIKHMPDGFHVLWYRDSSRSEFYTKSGKINGIDLYFCKDGELAQIRDERNDTIVGNAYWFDCQGKMIMREDSISINTISIDTAGEILTPTYKSYMREFNDNGTLEAEGIMLYFDTPIEDSFEHGEWKYYKHGVLKETKYYK